MRMLLKGMVSIALFAIMFLSGCSGAADSVDYEETSGFSEPQYSWGSVSGDAIVIWGDETDLKRPYIQKAFQRYRELTGNELTIEPLSKEEMTVRASDAFHKGKVSQPDVILSYGGTNLDKFNPDQNLYDFTEAQWVKDLTGVALNQTIYNGKVIGLPHSEVSYSGTLYNKEIFEACGIQVPKNQEEFMAACKVLKSQGITPMYLPYAEVSMLLYQFPMDSIFQDEDVLGALNDGALSYSQIPEMKKILQWYRTMAERGYFGQDYEKNDWGGMSDALESGDYAMMLCWDTWLYTDFHGDPSKFGLMPAFMGEPDGGCFEGPNMMLFTVNKNSERLESALNFITFISDPYNYNEAFKGIYTAPAFKNHVGYVSTPQFAESEQIIEENFFDSTANPRIKGFSQMDAVYIQRYMNGGEYSMEECLKDMDAARVQRAAQ